MQLYAFDESGHTIPAWDAIKQKDYYCIECATFLRVRKSVQGQPHFFHLEPPLSCRQHQKGIIHINLQEHLLNLLPQGDCQLEKRFDEINRIADVAWLSEKVIFEIQYSFITAQEVKARNVDYASLGWTVIWILHEQRYNKARLSEAEIALENHPHFFSNMNKEGYGVIYDQFDYRKKQNRICKFSKLPIDCLGLTRNEGAVYKWPLKNLFLRAAYWPIGFQGDLIHAAQETPYSEYILKAIKFEKQQKHYGLLMSILNPLKRVYRALLHHFLESACR